MILYYVNGTCIWESVENKFERGEQAETRKFRIAAYRQARPVLRAMAFAADAQHVVEAQEAAGFAAADANERGQRRQPLACNLRARRGRSRGAKSRSMAM